MYIKWREDLEIGIDEIDAQHKALFEKVNDLLHACNTGKAKEEVVSTLEFLSEYVVTHFKDEEAYHRKYKYPHYKEHAKLHSDFVEEIEELKRAYEEEGTNLQLVVMVNQKVVNWLINHIGKADKAFGKFVSSLDNS